MSRQRGGRRDGRRDGCRAGRRGEVGSASMLVVTMVGVLALVALATGVVAAIFVAHRVAQSAADLSALAGARAAVRGGDPCDRAAVVAEANGAELVGCTAAADEVIVEVEVPGPGWRGAADALRATARAGRG